MVNKLLLITKNDFQNTALYKSIESYVFNSKNFEFASSLPKSLVKEMFEDEGQAINDFLYFEPVIERLYFDLINGKIKGMVISFYDINDRVQYGLIVNNKASDKFRLQYINRYIKYIDTKENDQQLLNSAISKQIIRSVINLDLKDFTHLDSPCFFVDEGTFKADISKVNEETKELIIALICSQADTIKEEFIKLNYVTIDVEDLNNPSILKVDYYYRDQPFEFWIDDNDIMKPEKVYTIKDVPNYRDAFLDAACKKLFEQKSYILKDNALKKTKEEAEKFFANLYKKLTLFKKDDSYGYEELGDSPFIFFEDEDVLIKTSRDENDEEYIPYRYQDLNKTDIKKILDKYLLTKNNVYKEYVNEAQAYVDGSFDYETSKQIGESLINKTVTIPTYDRATPAYETLFEKVKTKYDKLLHLDKAKISNAINIMNKIKDVESYEKYSDDLFDSIDELGEAEMSAIKNEYEAFLSKFGDVPEYYSTQTIYRRVFIRKSALEHLKRLNLENKDLKILQVVDEIVDQLKTIPGEQLGKYLLNKGLNFPIKADRSVKKIRIMRNSKYRLLFVYGSDLDIDDRSNNFDSIYIFAVTEHKKDKSELYRVAESKPTKYEINDFIIYPKNKIVKIPECTTEQYKIATSLEDKPVITFGCAGSGKTTVSIEQYVNIVYTKFNCVSPSPEELVYITFHKGLSDKVKKDLAEFKIDANCYKLDEYFAYCIGKTYDPSKIINEARFINWFDKTYSQSEIDKNKSKKKNKIAPLLEKPDIARLLYTYYRGVFKGSKELLNTKEDHLDFETFISEMSGETYLSNEEKEAIYNLCKEFDDYALESGYLSDNDYALKVIRQSSFQLKRTNRIIIDEVQDLTEIEIIATIMTLSLDSNCIYFYGDPHQSINPNVFDSSTINRVYTELGKTSSSESTPLTITYRTNRHLISYLNELLKDRDKWIGLTKGGLSQIIEPPKTDDDTSWAGYVTNKDLYKRIFESNPNSMIITPSESARMKMLEKYPEIEPARVITIYDAKGMEWDTIIMYNMFTDYESYFLDMISENGKAKKSTIHRMTFNKYYVGCTRSTKSFVIIEENEKIFDMDNPIFNALLSSFAPIYKEEQIDTYILEDNTFEAWYKEALQNLDNDNTSTFEHALMHARRLVTTPEQVKLINELIEGNPDTLERYGFSYLERGEYDLARSAFYKCNKTTKKHGGYILLCAILSDRQLNEDHLREFLRQTEIINKYPAVLPKLMKQKSFKNRLRNLSNKLFIKENQ